jgi:hypothetical protein
MGYEARHARRSEEPFKPAVEGLDEVAENDRRIESQRDKLVAALYYDDPRLIYDKDLHLDPDKRAGMRDEIAAERLPRPAQIQNLLRGIKTPADDIGLTAVVGVLHDPRERAFVARFSRGYDQERDDIEGSDLKQMLHILADPIDFERSARPYLKEIEIVHGMKERAEYEESMATLKHKVYGKREEYWQRMCDLFGPEMSQSLKWQQATGKLMGEAY